MAKRVTPEPQGSKSKVWDASLPKGEQHTIYAPSLFFLLWKGDDSPLKQVVNAFLVEYVANEAAGAAEDTTPAPTAAKQRPPMFVPVTDDDI